MHVAKLVPFKPDILLAKVEYTDHYSILSEAGRFYGLVCCQFVRICFPSKYSAIFHEIFFFWIFNINANGCLNARIYA